MLIVDNVSTDQTLETVTNHVRQSQYRSKYIVLRNSENYNLPIITCENATQYIPVIYLKEGNDTNFFLQKECIIAESKSKEGFIALKDLIIYTIFDII